jgi:hypothetical protein
MSVATRTGMPSLAWLLRLLGRVGSLHLVSTHLAPSSPAIRLAEAEALALIANDSLVIAGGDWNAMPASDPEPPLDGIDPGYARRKLDRSAACALEEAGFTDVAAHWVTCGQRSGTAVDSATGAIGCTPHSRWQPS